MFGFSLGEIIVISAVVLLVLGPERIPQVAQTLGRFFAELRRASDEVRREFNYTQFSKDIPKITGLKAEELAIDKINSVAIIEPEHCEKIPPTSGEPSNG